MIEINVQIPQSLLVSAIFNRQINTGIEKGIKVCAISAMNTIRGLPASESYIDRTGALRNSIQTGKYNKGDMSIDVTAHKEYGRYINYGTRNKNGSTRIKASFFMERGLGKVSDNFAEIVGSAVEREIERA